MKINIASNEVVHFIGIGGIGMSGLAQIMSNMGFAIQGSDLSKNKNTERLIKSGIKVYFGHNEKNLKKATLIVISSAIKKNNKELKLAKRNKLPVFKRGEMLANIIALKKKHLSHNFFHIGPPRDFDLFKNFKNKKTQNINESNYLL